MKRWLIGCLVAAVLAGTLLFANGCESPPESPAPQATVDQMIHSLRTEAQSLEDFENRLRELGFVRSKTSVEIMGEGFTFRYSVFRRNPEGYIHLEFTDVRGKADELRLEFDQEETNSPRVIWSAGLRPLHLSHRFGVLKGLKRQWVGIYFVSRKEGDVAHGGVSLDYGDISWSSSY